ncbi:MAG: DUF2220 domain-containing protein [Clostridiales bacterium]|jgi:hypothetical protein|nr:DUF2220 domain-containing protein [Clostridiales bacterium]
MNRIPFILNPLLDKYESSTHGKGLSSNRRVLIKAASFPHYDYENADTRDSFNDAFRSLESQKIIKATWDKISRNLVIEFWLNLENVNHAYLLAERIPLSQTIDEIRSMLTLCSSQVKKPWIREFLASQEAKLNETRTLTGVLKKGKNHIEKLLAAFAAYDKLDEASITMRAFSIACYSNSKYFEDFIRDDFLSIARIFCPALANLQDADMGAREYLACLGIYARPEVYEFAGLISIETPSGVCDCSTLASSGFALTSSSLKSIRRLWLDSVNLIFFIENKTNYDEFIESSRPADCLAVYHGGYLSPQKRKFISLVASSRLPGIPCLFWADIDAGGFKMFLQLKSLIPELLPYKMGPDDVRRWHASGLARKASYMGKLQSMLQDPQTLMFKDTIEALLHYGVTIEQEAMLSEACRFDCYSLLPLG